MEFTGLIREYIKICERSLAEGRDFTQTNIHVQQPLKIELYEIAYLGEKLGCIYGTGLQTNQAWEHLKAAMQGNPPPDTESTTEHGNNEQSPGPAH